MEPLSAMSTSPPSASSLVACANGGLAKRAEDCPPASSIHNTTSLPSNASVPSAYPAIASEAPHPCPNAGYSCSECPDGFFCPPPQTTALSCPCGYGWPCGHCSHGWFCIPGHTAVMGSGMASSTGLGIGSGSGLVLIYLPKRVV